MIDQLRGLGKTVLLTSHYLDKVQHLADRVGVLSHGRLIAESAPSELGGRDTAETTISFQLPGRTRQADLPVGAWRAAERHGDRVAMRSDDPTRALLTLTSWAVARGETLRSLTVERPSLEDVYQQITGDAEHEGATHGS
jgi:ABC-2 type transport system ATP-binding protein